MDRAEKITKVVLEAILPAKLEYRAEQSQAPKSVITTLTI
jgi:hypothetical protein